METTILLSKVLGLFLIITGIIIMVRKEYFIPLISSFVKERLTRMIVSILKLLGGLFLVVTHNDFSTLPSGITTLFGWILVVESILYFAAPDKTIQKMISRLNVPSMYFFGGLASIVVGFYLAAFGFGWL